jgi:uncharacterized protein YdiU (UPF0061 family)
MIEITEPHWNFQHSYSDLPKFFHTLCQPTKVANPQLVIFNSSLAEVLGLMHKGESLNPTRAADIFSGNALPSSAQPLAQAYAGHQFGHFTTLGDGRALLLGEHITPSGDIVDIQFKGSGPTPYSRRGDGRAALKPMLREYIISEAMHALGIPTTRSLAVVASGEPVFRDSVQPGAILTRIASSHLRVGTFEHARAHGQPEDLKSLIEYTLIRHDPEAFATDNPTLTLLKNVIERQALLVARWMAVGFIHGVMNTDNMSLAGETIDYGPCAFMDTYNPSTVFSSIDREGRYAYANQPRIALWNLERFAETLLPFLAEDEEESVELAHTALESFAEKYNAAWQSGMKAKLGLSDVNDTEISLVTDLLRLMQQFKADYTNTFRALSHFDAGFPDNELFLSTEFQQWNERWTQQRVEAQADPKTIKTLMLRHNPSIIARNHRVEEALTAADEQGDLSVMESLLKALAAPFEDLPEHASFSQPPGPEWSGYRTFCGT